MRMHESKNRIIEFESQLMHVTLSAVLSGWSHRNISSMPNVLMWQLHYVMIAKYYLSVTKLFMMTKFIYKSLRFPKVSLSRYIE